ncbi:hypothetical protein GJU40_08855 [Bacillus lacus]|uniref:WYL domain-containing protein n=1 Tax=Metabacillus lacus TaxID=1983721 RepID=A0A7X2M002_9BACI|nr:WYL domain-containing protein [Metabacillus lacus]MRX72259.1 hypothetical protein [Metabacillus lacus]
MNYLLKQSLNMQTPVTIFYLSKSGEITQRSILVLGLTASHISAYCYKRGALRTFSLDRVLSAAQTGRNVS